MKQRKQLNKLLSDHHTQVTKQMGNRVNPPLQPSLPVHTGITVNAFERLEDCDTHTKSRLFPCQNLPLTFFSQKHTHVSLQNLPLRFLHKNSPMFLNKRLAIRLIHTLIIKNNVSKGPDSLFTHILTETHQSCFQRPRHVVHTHLNRNPPIIFPKAKTACSHTF